MKRDPDARKEQILLAAAEIFAATGYPGARVDSIASAARLNKRLLYHYVGDKAAIFAAVLAREAGVLASGGRQSVPAPYLWWLVLEEARYSVQARLLQALTAGALPANGDLPAREAALLDLARQLLGALLPDLVEGVLGSGGGVASGTIAAEVAPTRVTIRSSAARKPRVRMAPKLVPGG
jgi:AcrR family transcriptional regulator